MAKKQQQKPQKQRKWSSAVGGSETLATATGTVMLLDRSQCHAHLKDDTTTAFYTCSTTNTTTNNCNNNINTTNNLQHHRNMEKVRLPVMICHLRHLIAVAGLLLLLVAVGGAEGRRHAPLMFEESDTGRRSNRPAVTECQFGKVLRELGSTWYADLGPPFGVMYCIRCECVAIPKKRRIVARVQCRNIKNECPPAKCDDPISLPGKCCKTCPGDRNDTDVALDVPVPNEEEERNMKHYAALLTGRTSYFLKGEEMKSMYTTYNPHNVVATARFLFHKKNLYYSFYTSSRAGRPRAIQFVDDAGVILEEHQLETTLTGTLSVYQNATGKICGVWRRVPRDYKRILRDDRLHVVLLWGNKPNQELALAGKVAKYTALQTELFSSLLEPQVLPGGKIDPQLAGAGGTAIVSTSSGAASSMHLTLVFNGVFGAEEFSDAPVTVRIELPERKELVFDEVPRVRKPSAEINVLELSSPISIQNLRLMSRGKLLLTVESKKYPQLRIQGHIVTRASCEIFQTLLAPHSPDSTTKSSGLAWVYLNTDGSLAYNIETEHMSTRDRPNISLIEEQGKRRAKLEDLSPSFNFNQAIGSVEKLGPKVLESLYAGELGVNVGTEHETSLIRGRLVPRPVADARDSAEPILLKRQEHADPQNPHSVGMAWMSIDNECNLHYEVTLNGVPAQDLQLYLEEKPIEAIGAPVTRKLLEEFNGSYLEGFFLSMPSAELIKLEMSVCYLEVHAKHSKQLLLRGKLKSTKVPSHCFPVYTDNNVPVPGDHNDNHLVASGEAKCFHSGRFYNESEQWRSAQDSCQMCACLRGQSSCEVIKCPAVKCRAGLEQLLQREGECCPSCVPKRDAEWLGLNPAQSSSGGNATDSSRTRGCRLGDQFHAAGASWHPFLPPNGFDTCTTCSCDPLTLEIRCPRLVCPPLQCSEKLAYRPDKKACCKICPEGKQSTTGHKSAPNNPNVLQDQAMQRTPGHSAEEALANGGCKVVNKVYENGQEWHPVLMSHGEQKCIKCRCKDSKVNCDRKRCSRSTCQQQTRVTSKRRLFEKPDAAAPAIDECCSTQCRRSRRHHKRQPHHQQKTGAGSS
ncbi:dorsal-ventral patterning protein Sog [Drosophila ananassae]|uniref:dorsal-ventral patterning protein Sog n=1 Tax=Drosophila ananassae TaxID=7217 RepID=UPI0013A5E4AB|nr:dorsal-ventral patterning protein Sog [Drosophila ananassae]XP_044573149.1 dorsal-ventral patterning protein Sog [Drosophila ananassae]XP_044573150.1 dorsal-ventral patterning protein Sog [Drosophila ananassae]XP_044573151.1 dorsal-ventral patterning protein Sog [Drosophila ananassae]